MSYDQNICKFVPDEHTAEEIYPVNFVLETKCSAAVPAIRAAYALHLVTKGRGVFLRDGEKSKIEKGDIFFTTPTARFAIAEGDNLEYAYVSFLGAGAKTLLQRIVGDVSPVFRKHDGLIPFWLEALGASNPKNIDLLARSVLEFTAARLINFTACGASSSSAAKIKAYLERNYGDSSLSLKSVAVQFGYNEKYLSRLFFRYMGVRFNDYLTELRVSAACALLETDSAPVKEIAFACGFSDPLYFSKVFKAKKRLTPSQFAKSFPKGNT